MTTAGSRWGTPSGSASASSCLKSTRSLLSFTPLCELPFPPGYKTPPLRTQMHFLIGTHVLTSKLQNLAAKACESSPCAQRPGTSGGGAGPAVPQTCPVPASTAGRAIKQAGQRLTLGKLLPGNTCPLPPGLMFMYVFEPLSPRRLSPCEENLEEEVTKAGTAPMPSTRRPLPWVLCKPGSQPALF